MAYLKRDRWAQVAGPGVHPAQFALATARFMPDPFGTAKYSGEDPKTLRELEVMAGSAPNSMARNPSE
jgi:hypothetical protein